MTYLIYITRCLFVLNPKMLFNFSFIITSFVFNFYLFHLYQQIYQIYLKFHDRTNIKIQQHQNPLNKHYIYVPLDYKIYDIRYTILKLMFYIGFCFLPFFILRFLRLGTEISLIKYFNIFSSLPTIIAVVILINLAHFLLVCGIFWLNIYARFYKELKKLYIYLTQFGGCLDISNSSKSDEPYIYIYFLNPLNNITYKKLNLMLYRVIDTFQINCSKNKYFINKKATLFFVKFLKEIQLSIPLVYKQAIYILLFFSITLDLYFNKFIVKNLFYVLFFIFFYRQFYNLSYFSWYHNLAFDQTLALYYYKLNDLTKDDSHSHSLRMFYAIGANFGQNDRLLYYLNTGLNLHQSDAFRNKKEWPEYPYYYKTMLVFMRETSKNIINLINGYIKHNYKKREYGND